ncbi:threonylcarbamoyladenylate synthase [Saccharomycopsis crataegensis]|uniref:Threonylcarbamoyl-AMP synthase n=1 Tax=Saccharomycopsis crataegensis TaxID=43959 RepID=A0AAV5QWE3_9ASCO|nr:threonylcarbamoyladenylate synthase [Saccharomycopsis crataegensis]
MDTEVLKIDVTSIEYADRNTESPNINDPVTERNLQKAAKIITQAGGLVGFPTETVYGLGGSAINDESTANIFKAKNRPSDNPLIVHISSMNQLERIITANTNNPSKAKIPEIYKPLIEKFWPGPVSILIPIDTSINDKNNPYVLSKNVTNNLDTVAIRFPSDPVARSLIALSDTPIAAPSANTSTKPSPTMASHVYHDLKGKIPLILDGGNCNIGLESTVINGLVSPPTLLRPGGLSIKEIKKVPGFENLVTELNIKKDSNEPVRTPGMKYKHYSPNAMVYLIINTKPEQNIFKSEAIGKLINANETSKSALVSELGFGQFKESDNLILRELGTTVKDIQFNMFRLLREMDQLSVKRILLIVNNSTLEDEDGLAIINRLGKAASEKVYI